MASRSVAAPAAAPVAAQPAVLAVPAALPEVSPGDPPFSGSPTSSPPRSSTTAETGVELDSDEEALWEALVLAGRPAMQTMPTAPSNVAISELFDTVAVPAPPTNLRERIFELLVEGSDYDSDKFDDSQHDEQKEDVPADQWLFDSDDDDEDRPMLSRLRRGDETAAWHPPLPPAPAVHPSNGQENFYDPEAEWDYSKPCEVVRLLDVHGEVPHRCYLVEWKCTPLQLSWEWMEKLDKPWIREMMQRVDDWKASGSKRVFTRGNKKKRDNASAAGTCFMDGLRMALYYLGAPDLVTMAMWDAFEVIRPSDIQYGVSREDATEFFKELQRQSVPLNHEDLQRNILSQSAANVGTLRGVFEDLAPGVYLTSAGEDDLGHCFVVVSFGPNTVHLVLDGYNAAKDPPLTVVPLGHQEWIKYVKWICRVGLQPGYQCRHGKRKTRTQRKREKRLKLLLQQAQGM